MWAPPVIQDPPTKTPRSKIKTPRSKIKSPRSKSKLQAPKSKTPRSKIKTPRSKIKIPKASQVFPPIGASGLLTFLHLKSLLNTSRLLTLCSGWLRGKTILDLTMCAVPLPKSNSPKHPAPRFQNPKPWGLKWSLLSTSLLKVHLFHGKTILDLTICAVPLPKSNSLKTSSTQVSKSKTLGSKMEFISNFNVESCICSWEYHFRPHHMCRPLPKSTSPKHPKFQVSKSNLGSKMEFMVELRILWLLGTGPNQPLW